MTGLLAKNLFGLALAAGLIVAGPVFALGLDPAFPEPAFGPAKAKGVVVWSHGRSINAEDSQSPTPAYLSVLREDGWDVMRFDRLSKGDTLTDSTKRLVDTATSDTDKQIVVDAIGNLLTAYKNLPRSGVPRLKASAGAEQKVAAALASVPTGEIMSLRVGAGGAAAVELGQGLI